MNQEPDATTFHHRDWKKQHDCFISVWCVTNTVLMHHFSPRHIAVRPCSTFVPELVTGPGARRSDDDSPEVLTLWSCEILKKKKKKNPTSWRTGCSSSSLLPLHINHFHFLLIVSSHHPLLFIPVVCSFSSSSHPCHQFCHAVVL